MPNKCTGGGLRRPVGAFPHIPLFVLAIFVSICFLSVELAKAGECITSDNELYDGVVASYEAAKKDAISEYGGWGMSCWRGDQGLDTKLRKVLTDILFDSRIHPAHVASALQDYETVFGYPQALLAQVQKKQGRSRYEIIAAIRENKSLAFSPVSSKPDAFPGDMDFIDGPANIRKGPKEPVSGSLPDNAKVRILRKQGNWVEIDSDGIRGWTSSENLKSSHIGQVDADGFYVLSRAAYMDYYETVRFLLWRGARVDLIDGFGRNALHWAVRGGFAGLPQSELEMVKLLAAVPGVNVNNVDKEGKTPLLDSIALNRTDMMNILLGIEKIDVNLSGKEGSTPLMLAIRYYRKDMAAKLLGLHGLNIDAVDEQGRSALYHAVAVRDLATVKMLLDRKAKTDSITKDGKTLLHAAFEPTTWHLAPASTNIEDVKLLLEHRDIDINKADDKGNTIMYLAIRQDRPDLVKLLLSRPDLDVNKPTPGGGRYFHQVIGLPNQHYAHEMAMMLFDRQDIDVNTPYDHNGNTAVHMSWSFGNSAADIEIAKKILTHNPNLEAENEYGDTPLIYNVDQGKIEMVKLLVATKGIDLNHPDKTMRRTPLGLAKYRKDTEIAGLLQKAGAKEYSIRYFYKNLPVPGRIAVVIIGYVLPLLPTILLIISKTLRSKPLMIASLVIGILPVIAVIKLARTPLMVDDLNISPIILLMVCVPWLVIRTPAYLVCRIEDEKFKRLNFFLYTMSAIDALVLVVACIIGFGIVKQ